MQFNTEELKNNPELKEIVKEVIREEIKPDIDKMKKTRHLQEGNQYLND